MSEEYLAAIEEWALREERKRLEAYKDTQNLKQRAFHSALNRGRLYVGSNRAGKSYAGIMEAIMWCVCSPERPIGPRLSWFGRPLPSAPVRGRIVCPELPGNLDDPHVQRDKLAELVPAQYLRGGSFTKAYSVLGHTLYFKNDSRIEFRSSEQDVDKHAGESLNFCFFDEEIPRRIYAENVARLDREMGAWWITYTPVQGLQWMYEELYQAGLKGEKDIAVIEASMRDNMMYLRSGYMEEVSQFLSEEEREIRVEGKYSLKRGLVYDVFGPQHLVEVEVSPS